MLASNTKALNKINTSLELRIPSDKNAHFRRRKR